MLWLKVSSEVVRHIQMFNTESPVLGCIFMACQTLTLSQRRIQHRVGVYILLKWLTDTQTCQEGLSYPLCLVGCCPRCKVVCKLQLQIKPLDTIPTNREAISQVGWVNEMPFDCSAYTDPLYDITGLWRGGGGGWCDCFTVDPVWEDSHKAEVSLAFTSPWWLPLAPHNHGNLTFSPSFPSSPLSPLWPVWPWRKQMERSLNLGW